MPMFDAAHPGDLLRELMGGDITVTSLAKTLHVSRPTLSHILNGSAGVTAEMALRLEQAFPGTTARFWASLQTNYELSRATRKKRTVRIHPARPLPAIESSADESAKNRAVA